MAKFIDGNPVIYTIKSGDNLFVGATTNFEKKRQLHKGSINSYRRGELQDVRSLHEKIAANNFDWEMKVLKEFPCQNRAQLNAEVKRLEKELNTNMDMKSTSTNKKTEKVNKGDFTNAVVYTIKTGNSIFVGSTTSFEKRKGLIASKIYNPNETAEMYTAIRDNDYKWEMEIHSEVNCDNWRQLRKEEERIRELLHVVECETVPEPTSEPDKKTTIYKITAKRYAFLGFTDDFEEEKKTHTENALLFQRGRLMFHNVLCERLNMADFDWNIEIHSEFDYSTQSDIDLELERIRLQLEKTGDFDYVDTRARQIIYREQEISMINDPIGWAADVQTLPELPKLFFKRRQGTFYNFNGTKVFWYGRDINCEHNTVKHKMCRHCLYSPLNNKKTYLRDIDYYKHVEEQRYVRRQT